MRRLFSNVSKRISFIACMASLVIASDAMFVSAAPSSANLVAHWSYDQSSGTTLIDNSGNGHTGTFGSTPTWMTGKINNSLKFDGTDVVKLGNITQINGVSKLTFAAWIKRTSAGSMVLLGKQTNNQDVAIEAWSDGSIYFQMSKGSDTYGKTTLNDTAWHHVAMVFDGTQTGNANRLKSYIDGVQKTLAFTGTVGTTTTTNTTSFNIGKIGSDYSNGQIDDTWLYTRALSQAEVQDLALVSAPVPDTTAPSVPSGLTATAASQSQINLAWSASTDNVGVAGYRVYRDGVAVATTNSTSYQNTGLAASTTYNYTVRAYDAAGNESVDSTPASATTFDPPAPDTIAPTVDVSAPVDGATVSGTITVTANASDNVGVAGVTIYANGAQIGSEFTAAPYSTAWNTGSVANGTVQLTAVARDAAGNVTTSSPVTVTVNNVVQGNKFVASISSNGRYFLDQTGLPLLIKGDSPWAMFSNLSPSQVETWAANRQSHDFNAAIVSLIGSPTNGGTANSGATYDGIQPFVGGNITVWNEAYWTRMDNYLTTLKNHGITAFLYPMDGWNTLSGTAFSGKSAADCNTYGRMVATRYASYPNIVWMAGGDYNGYNNTVNTQFQNMLSGIRSTGDTRVFSTQLNNETLTTDVSFFESLSNWNFAYTYTPTYQKILRGYDRSPSTRDPRPVLFGEGNYEGEDNYGGPATTNETLRRQQIWSLTSGAAGEFTGSQDWQFLSGWEGRLDTAWVTQAQKIRGVFAGLNWRLLVPDEAAPIVTTGRGTKLTSDTSLDVLQNDYVTAAQTPDKSQTVIYVPTSLSGAGTARTITLNVAQLPTSFVATWVDPTDAAASQTANVDGSGNVTVPGAHADGTRDWLLVIR